MIAVDTSALMAIVLDEAAGGACMQVLKVENEILISAGTLAEAMIVAGRRNVGNEMARLVRALGLTVISVTQASAKDMSNAYDRWGKGVHPAGLNFGDCFAYVVANEHACRLLFVGDACSRTDLRSALQP